MFFGHLIGGGGVVRPLPCVCADVCVGAAAMYLRHESLSLLLALAIWCKLFVIVLAWRCQPSCQFEDRLEFRWFPSHKHPAILLEPSVCGFPSFAALGSGLWARSRGARSAFSRSPA